MDQFTSMLNLALCIWNEFDNKWLCHIRNLESCGSWVFSYFFIDYLHYTGYTCRPIIPAQKAELIDVARAMNREEFGPRVKKLFDPETVAATEAIKSGMYQPC